MRWFNRMSNASSHHGFSQREQDAGQDLPEDVVSATPAASARWPLCASTWTLCDATATPTRSCQCTTSTTIIPWSASRRGGLGRRGLRLPPTDGGVRGAGRRPLQTPSQVMVFSHLIGLKAPGVDFSGVPSPLAECPCTANVAVASTSRTTPLMGGSASTSSRCQGSRAIKAAAAAASTASASSTTYHPPRRRGLHTLRSDAPDGRYADVTQDARPLAVMENCEFTRGEQRHRHGEITIPQCAAGTPDSECTYTWEYEAVFAVHADCLEMAQQASSPRERMIHAAQSHGDERVRELAYLKPHLRGRHLDRRHRRASTARSAPRAGRRRRGLRPWARSRRRGGLPHLYAPVHMGPDTAPRLARLHPLRLVAVHAARRTHYGVMSGISARAHTPT